MLKNEKWKKERWNTQRCLQGSKWTFSLKNPSAFQQGSNSPQLTIKLFRSGFILIWKFFTIHYIFPHWILSFTHLHYITKMLANAVSCKWDSDSFFIVPKKRKLVSTDCTRAVVHNTHISETQIFPTKTNIQSVHMIQIHCTRCTSAVLHAY